MLQKIIQQVLERTVDILFPPTAEALLVRAMRDDDIYTMYAPRTTAECIALTNFKNPNIRALIHEAKFHGNERAQHLLAKLLVRYFEGHLTDVPHILVPIPLSSLRIRERGYNQVLEVISNAQKLTPNIRCDSSVLTRTIHTRPQTEMTRAERILNMVNVFAVRDAEKVKAQHIVLIDDVCTTGATLREAKAALLPHAPSKITCIALAH